MFPGDTDNNTDDNYNGNNNLGGGNNFGEEEFESGNTSENQDGGVWGNEDRPKKRKKRYHRHTPRQISQMEAFFKECPHPDDKQRKDLSRQIGLDSLQIKFWFQNKRTQLKNQLERQENGHLRRENERLRADHHRYQVSIARASCPNCEGPTAIGEMSFEEHHLRLENARIAQEIAGLTIIAQRYMDQPVINHPFTFPPTPSPQPFEFGMTNIERDVYGNGGNVSRPTTEIADCDKQMIVELAVGAMEELMKMAEIDEPLWMGGVNGMGLALNLDEYTRMFGKGLGPIPNGFRVEASRETAVVAINHMDLVAILMDQNQWPTMFAGMIAKANTLEVLSTGMARSFDGNFHLITAEFQVLSPLVSTRENYFVRYCKQHGDGLWAVVDVSVDHLAPNLQLKCRRRPSGCLIQEISNNYCKVTWVEHVEVDDRGVHNMYKQLICSGQAFDANRWIATLDRQCERLASIMATNPPSIDSDSLIRITNHGKKGMLKLAERMARSFFTGVSSSTENMWYVAASGSGEGIRVMTSKSLISPGRPPGVVLCAATSFWVPVPPKTVFDFLSDQNNRAQWDVFSTRGIVQKIAQIANGRDSRNCVSLLQSGNTERSKMMMMIQESSTDPTASFVIYAPVDVLEMESVLHGGESDYVAILPSGFAILPDGTAQPGGEGEGGGGSLLTVAFQMIVDSSPSGRLSISSVATVENLIHLTVENIKALYPF